MVRAFLLSCVVAVAAVSHASAHHTNAAMSHTMATVRVPAGLLVQGKPLPGGTYELIVTDERPAVESGTPSENQRWVEFVQNGTVVAREIAEMSTASEQPVGTSGTATAQAAVQPLRGGEFVRIAISAGGARYLLHLPPAAAAAH